MEGEEKINVLEKEFKEKELDDKRQRVMEFES